MVNNQGSLWSTTKGESYLELKCRFDPGTRQWVITSWDDRKEIKVTIGTNICILFLADQIKRFTRFAVTAIGRPQIQQEQTILNPTYKLYIFHDEGNNATRILVENPYVASPRLTASNNRVSVKIMYNKGQISGPEVLNFEKDTQLALVSVSTKAGYLNIPTGRDLLTPAIPAPISPASVSFDLTASDGSTKSGSPRSGSATSSPRAAGLGNLTRSPAGSPRRSPRTPHDYQNLIFWRPTVHPGTPPVYYFGRQATRDEEIDFINQIVGHFTSEAEVRFTGYLGPWDLFTS